jgi:hypothetical protein
MDGLFNGARFNKSPNLGTKGFLEQLSNTSLLQTIFCLKLIGVTLSNAQKNHPKVAKVRRQK